MKRELYIDNISGVMIIVMICYHLFHANKLNLTPYELGPLSFYLFWFFFKSGMLSNEKTLYYRLKNTSKKYIRPFVVFAIIGYLIWLIKNIIIYGHNYEILVINPLNDFLYTGSPTGNEALWFLPTMLAVVLIAALFRNYQYQVPIICFFLICLEFFVTNSLPYYISNILLGCLHFI